MACRVEYALDAVLESFREMNEVTGDGGNWCTYDGDPEPENVTQDKALPTCDNDFDLRLLRRQLCNNDYMPTGPYRFKEPM